MLTFIDVIPAKGSIQTGEALNLLGGAANDSSALETDISVWARSDRGWTALLTKRFQIGEKEHKHLYFTLPPECLMDFEDELELIIRDTRPREDESGVMVFIG